MIEPTPHKPPHDHPLWPEFKKWADENLSPNTMWSLYWACWLKSAAVSAAVVTKRLLED